MIHTNMKTRIIAIIASLICISSCTKPDETVRVLEQSGYKNIQITGWRPLSKSQDDTFSTGFRATSPSGQIVTGTVSSGILKGATIRLD